MKAENCLNDVFSVNVNIKDTFENGIPLIFAMAVDYNNGLQT